MPEFNDVLTTIAPTTPALTHGTTAKNLLGILQNKALTAHTVDKDLGEKLIFLFYGRPDYRPPGQSAQYDVERDPVFLVLAPEIAKMASNIFPFDTGGHSYYNTHLHGSDAWKRFSMAAEQETPGRVVGGFYDDNEGYYLGWPSQAPACCTSPPDVQAYYKMITDESDPVDDGRRSAIELSVVDRVPLSGVLRLVIGPGQILKRPEVEAALEPYNCVIMPYDVHRPFRWTEFRALIRGYVKGYMTDQGML